MRPPFFRGAALCRILFATLIGASYAPSRAADAAAAWPDKPVRLVVPYSPGGTTDYAARQVAQKLSETTGKTFIVDNKTGASGTIATQEVVRSAPDGSTFLVTDTTYAMLPLLFSKLPWDYRNDLVHVSEIIETPLVLLVPEKSPFKTMGDLIAHARANPGKLNFGSGGQASSTHLAAEMFKSDAGVTLTHIPYRGAGAALADVMAGQIDMLITAAPTAIPPVQGARVRALAVTGDVRLQTLPDVPTFAQAGLASYQVVNWFGLAAPKGTPAPIVDRMNRLVAQVMQEPGMRETMARQGAQYRPMSVAQFGDYVRQQESLWADVGKRVGIKPE
ncbi:Tripartite tricarboxylate transporter family receptor [compost metagenome]|uniref:Bug family tripartite tricarboxylate transporter substrate binding protein n=1 Tax=Achromobacter sp. Root83 TaxID=1736602 RepID=UPI00070D814C|nr:tripartite tricarboxylate transporter substrate binding protein [Achromobacter sp. Root83]KRC78635.1 ABC transporter substrate-binding protein [Achromobacter sp. Root83]